MSEKQSDGVTRRTLLTGTAAAAGALVAGSPVEASDDSGKPGVKIYKSADFYKADGTFVVDTAREAYFDMFRRFGYPISETVKKEMWILDFGLGDFARVGMAGIFWINRQDFAYFGHEIYLLPNQMIAEHRHLATDKGPPKMESWQPRHGMVYTFGEGDPTTKLIEKIPPSQRDLVHSKHAVPLNLDELGSLNRLKAWHFMVAGDEGALVTEYGTFHDMDGLRFSNPKATL